MSAKSLLAKLDSFKNKKVLILGDVGLDEYVLGQVRRISPEAPVPVLDVDQEDLRLGLSANVAQNVASLGGVPILLSVVGQDEGAQKLKELCGKSKISWDGIVSDSSRPTTRKMRIMAGPHHIVRVDYELRKYLSPQTEHALLQAFEKQVPFCDVVILEDYAKGVVSENVMKSLVKLCRQHNKRLLVDPHRENPGSFYEGCDLIKPNYEEAVILAGLDFDSLRENPNRVQQAGRALQKRTGAHQVVLTQGKDGMSIFDGDQISQVPTRAQKVFDVTGAGDTVIAAIALGVAGGLDLFSACGIANYAAGIVVGKIGCVPCDIEELKANLQNAPM